MLLDWPLIAAGLLAFVIMVYVILDGFDLGVGILFPYAPDRIHRDMMMNSVAPVWDGNETWLVMGGSLLYGAFPSVYSFILPLLYVPIFFMLAALVFRGVAFEFRFKSEKNRFIWDMSFTGGSMIAAFFQGVILGTFVQGYDAPLLNGNTYHWLTPFTICSGIAVVFGYALLGATWLIGKTSGNLQAKMVVAAKFLLPLILILIAIVSLWTPFLDEFIKQRWLKIPNIFYLSVLPILTLLAAGGAWYALKKQNENWPFYLVISIFILCYAGFGISSFPYLVPHHITLWEGASNIMSLKFILFGAALLMPFLLGYTIYAYRVFHGKMSEEMHYH